ncbi:MAG TPA: FG-GAP-like repeat-containing protein [Terriglobales bacterium]|jgi:hypothetical protein|nr:FG-GAP-like repeat-containing protein [Terriglobales bacterium]
MPRVRMTFTLIAVCLLLLIPGTTSAQSANFLTGRNFPASQSDTTAILTVEGDFNGDGKPDLIAVTSSLHGYTLSVLLGNGDGTFQTPATIGPGPSQGIAAIEVGDFNEDGHLDFVFTQGQYGNNTISVYLGNGDGTFQTPITTTLASPPQLADGLAVGDFNGDGKSDVALTANAPQQGAGTVEILIGNGDGTFKAPVAYPNAYLSWKIAVGDFNGDGKLDLVTAGQDFDNTGISVLLGNGNGTFQAAQNSALFGLETSALVVGDFNRDGKDDLAVSDAVLLSNGDGTFQSPITNAVTSPNVIADFNNDGILDLVSISGGGSYSSDASIFLGNGDGTFQQPFTFQSSLNPLAIFGTSPISIADFNGDGKIDLAGPGAGNGDIVTVVLGNGDGTFRAEVTLNTLNLYFTPYTFTTADLRNNGKTDFILFGDDGNGLGYVGTFLGNENGTFQAVANYQGAGMAFGGAVADFNNDGKPDVVSIGYLDQFAVILGNGDGTFQDPALYKSTTGTTAVAVGDFNGDGNQDIVVPGSTGAQFYLGNGDGTFGFPVEVAGIPVGLVGDFNGDGRPDLVSGGSNSVEVFLNTGNLTFQEVTTSTGMESAPAALADLNHDGKLDLVANVGGGVLVLLGNGDGTFESKGTFATGTNPSAVAVGDFNGDGIPDLAAASGSNVSVLLGNGDGTFQSPVVYDAGPLGMGALVAADFNGDGKIDLATLNGFSIALLFNAVGLVPGASLSPTTLAFAAQEFNTTSPAQKITLTNPGGVNLSVTQIAISGADAGDFAESNTCGNVVDANASCTISVTFTPTAFGARSGMLSITDAVGVQTVALTGTGAGSPSLGIGTPSGGSNSATVSAGSTAKYTLAIGGGGISGSASLTCTGAPAKATCTVPGSESVSATSASTFTVSVSTTAPSSAILQRTGWSFTWFWATALIGMVWLPVSRKPRRFARTIAAVLSLLLVTFLVSCGGGNGSSNTGGGGSPYGGTPAGTYTLTVTATMGNTTQSQTLKLTVQ